MASVDVPVALLGYGTVGAAVNRMLVEGGDDIERARRQYVQRVPEALPGRETLFDEEVVRTLANGDATLLRTGS